MSNDSPESPAGLLAVAGAWSGTDRLWFVPDELANEGDAVAVVRPTLGDALGSYEGDGETWGWRVAVAHPEPDRLEITMWNVSPSGEASRSVVTQLARDVDPDALVDAGGGA